jgi:hypothetical protein
VRPGSHGFFPAPVCLPPPPRRRAARGRERASERTSERARERHGSRTLRPARRPTGPPVHPPASAGRPVEPDTVWAEPPGGGGRRRRRATVCCLRPQATRGGLEPASPGALHATCSQTTSNGRVGGGQSRAGLPCNATDAHRAASLTFIFKGRFLKKKSRCARRKGEGGDRLYPEGADLRVPKKEAVIPQ